MCPSALLDPLHPSPPGSAAQDARPTSGAHTEPGETVRKAGVLNGKKGSRRNEDKQLELLCSYCTFTKRAGRDAKGKKKEIQ